ncbi:permease [Clostridium sp. Cult2]|uniref:permease n=1 Tax=Clostridium sp. Cult2 TaxID=2079003 RepID=UPI001F2CE3FF|nr:permease [Clostridium sp. Cult2]MCF6464750.1 permease [Clostridium sp. Cult2]
MKILRKYMTFIIASIVILTTYMWNQEIGLKAVDTVKISFKEMMMVIPPVFILMGLLDVWVPKDVMVKYMGEGSGIKGILLSMFLGSAAAGPLYGAFPVAAVLMKKGVKLTNILIFIGAWSTTKIPMFLFELSSLGSKFAITRLIVNIPGILLIAYIIDHLLSEEEKVKIYELADEMG